MQVETELRNGKSDMGRLCKKDNRKKINNKELKQHERIYQVWLLFVRDGGYISDETYTSYDSKYDALEARIYKLFEN